MRLNLNKKEILFVRNLLLTTLFGGIIGILNYLFNVFVARYTSVEIFSIFSASLGIIYLIQIPALSIQATITKDIAQNEEKDRNYYKWYSLIIYTALGLLFSAIFFLQRGSIAEIASIPTELVFFLSLTMLFAFVSPISKGLLLGKEKIVTVNIILFFETVLKFLIGWIAIREGGVVSALILANSIPAIVTTILILPFIKFNKTQKEKIAINFKQLGLITISFLLLTAPFTLDLILVNQEFRAEYSAISLIGKLIYFACTTTAAVLLSRLVNQKDTKEQKKSLILATGLTILIGLSMSLFYFLFDSFVVNNTVGIAYMQIGKYIGIYGICMTGFSTVYMMANYFISKGYYKYIYILLFATLLQIVLFQYRNTSLDIVLTNQIVVYLVLTLGSFLYLIFTLKKSDEEGNR